MTAPKAIELAPTNSAAYNNLGLALKDQMKLDAAVAAFHQAIARRPNAPAAHFNLGLTLARQKKLSEAAAAYRKADHLLPNQPRYRNALRGAERWLELDKKLTAVLTGKARPTSPRERAELGLLCVFYKSRYHTAVRFFSEAFSAEPKLAEDLRTQHRYYAACTAILAAAGKGEDAVKLDDQERSRLRKLALDWFRADLAAYSRLNDIVDVSSLIRQRLTHRLKNIDLAVVRDDKALVALPEAERKQWRQLWADVATLLGKTSSGQ